MSYEKFFKVFMIGIRHLRHWLDKDSHLGLFGIIVFCFPALTYSLIRQHDLNQRTAYTLGVIISMENGGKSAHKVYEYNVAGKTYTGTAPWGGLTKIRVGDSVIVAYEYTKPQNSEVYRYFESRLDRSKLPDTVYYRQAINEQRRPLRPSR